MIRVNDEGLQSLALGVIENAAEDAKQGNPTAGAWLLSDQAATWAQAAGLDDGWLGLFTLKIFERLANGI